MRWCVVFFIVLFGSCQKEKQVVFDHQLPIVKITGSESDFFSDSLGIYVVGIGTAENWQGQKANYFAGRKIPVLFQYFVDDKEVIRQQIGLKVSGGGSRKQLQKSFNIYTGGEWGKKNLDYPFFKQLPYTSYKSLRLRVSGQDWRKTHMRDALMHRIVRGLDIDCQAYQPVVLYLNTEYWGIYNLREKFNKSYLRQHHNFDSEVEFDMLEQEQKVEEGRADDYNELLGYIRSHNLSIDSHFRNIENKIDLNNLIDYYAAQIYFANTDWPGNNIKFWKAQQENARWRWFLHDTDLGFARAPLYGHPGGIEHNTLEFNLSTEVQEGQHNQAWSTFLFRNLSLNQIFRNQFKSRFLDLLDSDFSSSRVLEHIDSIQAVLDPEMEHHINKWKEDPEFYQSKAEWENNVELLREFARKRPDIIRSFLEAY